MKKLNAKIYFLALFAALFYSCSDNEANEMNTKAESQEFEIINVTNHDGKPFSTGTEKSSLTKKYIDNPGGGVMMQAFYWDVPAGGNWWNVVNSKLAAWSNAGIGSLWLPPVSKAQNGAFSMGYDPTDYFDFGNYYQNGITETRFGSKTELVSLITKSTYRKHESICRYSN